MALHEYMFGGAQEKFRFDQPRVPRGNPDGGQWTRVNLIPLLEILAEAGGVFWRSWRLWASSEARRKAMGWVLGAFKSPRRWANQVKDRDWTPEQITEVIRHGERFPAPNKVHPQNTATRYQDMKTGRFVVKDDVTQEILQVSGRSFKPDKLP